MVLKRVVLTCVLLCLCCRGEAGSPGVSAIKDFTAGQRPTSDQVRYSLRLGAMSGVANGMQDYGRDATQIYVSSGQMGEEPGPLQIGDVILGIDGKRFDGYVIETWRNAIQEARENHDGQMRVIRWRAGKTETIDFVAVPPPPPDLTQAGVISGVDRSGTYNLGSTGMRGWIYTKGATTLDGRQGRTTTASRQILVTHVGTNSPAAGIMQGDDVIIGTDGVLFADDVRQSIARAIQEAETEKAGGKLDLLVWREGAIREVQLTLRVMGRYSDAAPYHCAKSKRIVEEACAVLAEETPEQEVWQSVNGLALMATGKPEYLPVAQVWARSMAAGALQHTDADASQPWHRLAWKGGFKAVFLGEYYLLTGDKDVLSGIQALARTLARGQSLYGTYGHGFAARTPEGEPHGSVPHYGALNQAGLTVALGLVLARKCGIEDDEVDAAIERASRFFGYYVNKGGIPYGEHVPFMCHGANGKHATAALFFALQGNRVPEARYYAKMCVAAFKNREYGHTGQGFSYLWGALGANVGGPDAVAAFFQESSWHIDLARRCDGSFAYDGREQYGPGATRDNTYYGTSSYFGMLPTAAYVLTYSLPLQNLYITGKEPDKQCWLRTETIEEAIASGNHDLARKEMGEDALMTALGDWSPIARSWAAAELAQRPGAESLVSELIALAQAANGSNARQGQGAVETLGLLRSKAALPVFVGLLSHEDRWLRFKAAEAIGRMGDEAEPYVPILMQTLVANAVPLQPVDWADPIQLAAGQLGMVLFADPLRDSVEKADRALFYATIRTVLNHPDGTARHAVSRTFDQALRIEDVELLGEDILEAIRISSPANTMFKDPVRWAGLRVLAKYRFREGIPLCLAIAEINENGRKERIDNGLRTLLTYGAAAKTMIPVLDQLEQDLLNHRKPGPMQPQIDHLRATRDAIRQAQESEPLRSLPQESDCGQDDAGDKLGN